MNRSRLSDHLHVLLALQPQPQRPTHQLMVIGEHNLDRRTRPQRVLRFPSSRALQTCRHNRNLAPPAAERVRENATTVSARQRPALRTPLDQNVQREHHHGARTRLSPYLISDPDCASAVEAPSSSPRLTPSSNQQAKCMIAASPEPNAGSRARELRRADPARITHTGSYVPITSPHTGHLTTPATRRSCRSLTRPSSVLIRTLPARPTQ